MEADMSNIFICDSSSTSAEVTGAVLVSSNIITVHTDIRGGVGEDDRPAGPLEQPAQRHHDAEQQHPEAPQTPGLPQEGHRDGGEGPGETFHTPQHMIVISKILCLHDNRSARDSTRTGS